MDDRCSYFSLLSHNLILALLLAKCSFSKQLGSGMSKTFYVSASSFLAGSSSLMNLAQSASKSKSPV